MTEASEKKDVQKLQRVVIDSLEDIKAQDIQAFNTEHLSALFERVIIASGTSNRQTKALAASVRDEVRDAGFGKPRIEGGRKRRMDHCRLRRGGGAHHATVDSPVLPPGRNLG